MKRELLLALLCALILSGLYVSGAFTSWNYKLTDALYGGDTALSTIKIVAIDDKSIQTIGRWPWNRTAYVPLLDTLRDARVVAFDIGFYEQSPDDFLLAQAMREHGRVVIAQEYDFSQQELLTPALAFDYIARGTVNVYTDPDGVVRKTATAIEGAPSFASMVLSEIGIDSDLAHPYIRFVGPPPAYETVSFIDVAEGRIPADTFRESIVVVGATAPSLHDDYIVPTSNGKRMSGAELHGHILQTILTKSSLRHQSSTSVIIGIFALCLLTALALSLLPLRFSFPLIFIVWFGILLFAIFIFKRGLIMNLVYPSYSILLTLIVVVSYKFLEEKRHRSHVQSVFGRYVSKDVVAHLLSSHKAIELGGEEREITAMFADIRGFTALSEKMTPHEVIRMLNHYFGDMTDLVFEHNGTLDKFIGDCLFAIWGSPLEDKDHAINAIRCALAIQEKLKTKHNGDIPPIDLGIGICSGPAVVGNMGSSQRQEFTAIGDTVNTASRMSGKAEKGQIIIPQSTYDLVKGKIRAKKLQPVMVKGKEKPLQIYLVQGLA